MWILDFCPDLLFTLLNYPRAALFLAGVALFGWGLIDLKQDVDYPSPIALTISQFEANAPTSGWYRISGGLVDLSRAEGVNDENQTAVLPDRPTKLLAAVRGPGDATGSTPKLYLRSSDPSLIADIGPNAPVKQIELTGMVENRDILAPDGSVVLVDGEKPPSILLTTLKLAAGIFACLLATSMLSSFRRSI